MFFLDWKFRNFSHRSVDANRSLQYCFMPAQSPVLSQCTNFTMICRCAVGTNECEDWICRQKDKGVISTDEPFSHLTSDMIHTIGALMESRPATAPVRRNVVSKTLQDTLAGSEGQSDCSMVGWNTLLRFIEHQTVDGCKFHDASDELDLSYAAQGEPNAPSDAYEDPSHNSPSFLEGDDLVDMASRLKIARAVALLLKLSDAAGRSRARTICHGIRTKSASARCNASLPRFQPQQRTEVRASHNEVNNLPSWQYQRQKATSARASVDRSGENSGNPGASACAFIVDIGLMSSIYVSTCNLNESKASYRVRRLWHVTSCHHTGRPRSRSTSYQDPRGSSGVQQRHENPAPTVVLDARCRYPQASKSPAIKLAFGKRIEAVDDRNTRGEKVTSLMSGRCSLQVKVRRPHVRWSIDGPTPFLPCNRWIMQYA